MPTDDQLDSISQRVAARLTSILGRLPDDDPAGTHPAYSAYKAAKYDVPNDPYRTCEWACKHDLSEGCLVGDLLEDS